MYARMYAVSDRLEAYGLTHQSVTPQMLQRMSGNNDPNNLAVLASAVQPPRGYERESLKEYDWHSPLNHLVDAVPPESERARQFSNIVKAIAAGSASQEQWQTARQWLTEWRDNDEKIQPVLKNSDITAELAPVSQTLSHVSAIGLRALDNLQKHQPADGATTQSDLQALKAAEKPQAVLRDMIVAPVELLVQAASKR
jgi:hexosaminidase